MSSPASKTARRASRPPDSPKTDNTSEDLQAKDQQIATLQHRIETLEKENQARALRDQRAHALERRHDRRALRDLEHRMEETVARIKDMQAAHTRELLTVIQRRVEAELQMSARCNARVRECEERLDWAQTVVVDAQSTGEVPSPRGCVSCWLTDGADDFDDLRRLHSEEREELEESRLGLPPPYDSVGDVGSYLSPYAANEHADAGPLDLATTRATVTTGFEARLREVASDAATLRASPGPEFQVLASYALCKHGMEALMEAVRRLRATLRLADQFRDEPETASNPRGRTTTACQATGMVVEVLWQVLARALAIFAIRPVAGPEYVRGWVFLGLREADDVLAAALQQKYNLMPVNAQVPDTDPVEGGNSGDSFTVCGACKCWACRGYCDRQVALAVDLNRLYGLQRDVNRVSMFDRPGHWFRESIELVEEILDRERPLT
jgi:hypothetical protein